MTRTRHGTEQCSGSPRSRQRKTRVLIVDDEPSVLNTLRIGFESAGYKVETARNGVEANERVCAADCGCMVMDIHMPGVDGLELLLLMQSKEVSVPTVVMTGSDDFDPKELEAFANVVGFFRKPFDINAMVETVAACAEPKVNVMVITRSHTVTGKLAVAWGQDISDALAEGQPYLELTDAEITDAAGLPRLRASSLNVGRDQVEAVVAVTDIWPVGSADRED